MGRKHTAKKDNFQDIEAMGRPSNKGVGIVCAGCLLGVEEDLAPKVAAARGMAGSAGAIGQEVGSLICAAERAVGGVDVVVVGA